MFGVITFLLRETVGAATMLLARPATPEDVREIVRAELEDFERRIGVLVTYQDETVKM